MPAKEYSIVVNHVEDDGNGTYKLHAVGSNGVYHIILASYDFKQGEVCPSCSNQGPHRVHGHNRLICRCGKTWNPEAKKRSDYKGGRSQIALYVPKELKDRFSEAADREGRTMSSLGARVIQEYLDRK